MTKTPTRGLSDRSNRISAPLRAAGLSDLLTDRDGARTLVTLLPGDGIGPEVVGAARRVIEGTGAPIDWEERAAGREVFEAGDRTGVPSETIDSIARTGCALKGPLETPIGHGGKSANVTLRKMFETFGNIRPARAYAGIESNFAGRPIDMIVVRENVEDLYAGVEHMASPGVAQALKLVSAKGCEKIVRLAFEVARAENRKRVTCVTKANILKLTEGMLKRSFETISAEYPDIENDMILVDNAAHQLVRKPDAFDVMVMTNMNGDILSDLVSGLVGGLGLAPGANIGTSACIFEAVHGTAPDIAGRDLANPTATILSSVMMLRHLGFVGEANQVEAAVAKTLAQGPWTGDVAAGRRSVGTREFTDAILENLGKQPDGWVPRNSRALELPEFSSEPDVVKVQSRRLLGADIFLESSKSAAELGAELEQLFQDGPLRLKLIGNRGQVVWPAKGGPTDCVDVWHCRFLARRPDAQLHESAISDLLQKLIPLHLVVQFTRLQELDGKRAYTLLQGEE